MESLNWSIRNQFLTSFEFFLRKALRTDLKDLDETDAAEFDGLLADAIPPVPEKIEKVKTSTTDKKTEEKFMIKRDWAKKAECDDDSVYEGYRRTKGLDSIKDLVKWTKDNVIKFENGKMFQTLFESDDLFNNPGLLTHEGARSFVEDVLNNREVNRHSNTLEFGFKTFVRAIVPEIFKEKARGLVLRNLEAKWGTGPNKASRIEFGIFLDEVLKYSSEIEGNHGRNYTNMDKFMLEHLKNDFLRQDINLESLHLRISHHYKR